MSQFVIPSTINVNLRTETGGSSDKLDQILAAIAAIAKTLGNVVTPEQLDQIKRMGDEVDAIDKGNQ